jgi:hypothetical protein
VRCARAGLGAAVDRLDASRGLRVPPRRPDTLLDLAGLPAVVLARPRAWRELPRALDALLAALG